MVIGEGGYLNLKGSYINEMESSEKNRNQKGR